jgi:hypothetical protein
MAKRGRPPNVKPIAKFVVVQYTDSCRNIGDGMPFDTYEEAQKYAVESAPEECVAAEDSRFAVNRMLVCQVWGYATPPENTKGKYTEIPD